MQFRTGRPEQLRRAEWAVCLGATLTDAPYSYVWGRQTERFIEARGGHIETVPISMLL